MIEPALKATPAVTEANTLTTAKRDAMNEYQKLTEEQKTVIRKSPEISRQIVDVLQRLKTETNLKTIAQMQDFLQKTIEAGLRGEK